MQSRERKMVKGFAYGFLVLAIAFFVLFESKNILAGPQIIIDKPINGETSETSLTKIFGRTENISEIKLNGRDIFVDEEGNFEEQVLLSYGYNTIVLEAKDRFNRKTKKKLELILK